MAAKVYVGNLSWNTTDDSLAHAFSAYGQLTDYIVMKDRETGRSRGFGFVTFASQGEADAAIAASTSRSSTAVASASNMANSRPAGGMGGGYGGVTGQYGANAYGGQGGYGGGFGGQPADSSSRAATAATSSPASSPSRVATALPSRATVLLSRVLRRSSAGLRCSPAGWLRRVSLSHTSFPLCYVVVFFFGFESRRRCSASVPATPALATCRQSFTPVRFFKSGLVVSSGPNTKFLSATVPDVLFRPSVPSCWRTSLSAMPGSWRCNDERCCARAGAATAPPPCITSLVHVSKPCLLVPVSSSSPTPFPTRSTSPWLFRTIRPTRFPVPTMPVHLVASGPRLLLDVSLLFPLLRFHAAATAPAAWSAEQRRLQRPGLLDGVFLPGTVFPRASGRWLRC